MRKCNWTVVPRGLLLVSFIVISLVLYPLKGIGNDNILNFLHYTNKDGLPSSYVKSITQDRYGFIWVATRVSVSRFDGKNFKEFLAYDESGNPYSLMCNKIFTYSDSMLIARTNKGSYFYFDFEHEFFKPYKVLNNLGTVQALEPCDGGFWICRDNNLYFVDAQSDKLQELREKVTFGNIPNDVSFVDIKVKNQNMIAITENKLLVYFDFKHSRIRIFEFPATLASYIVSAFYLDSSNNVWIGDETSGLFRLNLDNGLIENYSKDFTGDKHISHNLIHCFTEDHQGRVWIGTEAGLCIWSPKTGKFTISRYELSNPTGLNTDPIYDAFCDKGGNVWLGTYFGGINFWSAEKSFFRTWTSGVGDRQLGGNVVSCLTEDHSGNIWIGLEDLGVNKLDISTGKITRYSSSTADDGLSYNNVHDVFFFSDNTLWIGTYTGGINIMNTLTEKCTYINMKTNLNLPSDNIYSFLPLGDSVFVATSNGIAVYDNKKRDFKLFYPEILGGTQFESMCKTLNRIWFSASNGIYYYDLGSDSLYRFDRIPGFGNINFVKSDSRGRVWIGDCYSGLCCFDKQADSIFFFNKENGFPVSWIFSIEEGHSGWFWVSSDKGLVRLNPEKSIFTLYDSNSGIPFNQFNYRASYKDSWGNIYFGGNNGMVSFNENDNPDVSRKMEIFFTGMQLFNKPVMPGKKSPLKKSINEVDQIKLDHSQNVFTIEYSALSYSYAGKCQYAYYLENFENEWNYVGNRDFASYTNLSPGTYYLHVKGSVSNIFNEQDERVLKIIVRPPFYLSLWAFLLYFVLAWGMTMMFYWIGKRFEKSKAQVEMERREKQHANELHQLKLEFFTNISHELKTPLTLILGPTHKLLKEEKLSPAFRRQLLGVEKNAQRLYNIINQLLEFRKIDDGKEKLKVARCNLEYCLKEIRDSFEQVAENKNINFKVIAAQRDVPVWFDVNKIDKIIFNLLSNAFKFTNEGGTIELKVDVGNRDGKKKNGRHNLVISVSDTGKGMTPEVVNRVFDRFFQFGNEGLFNQGIGIGLAYVKSLVAMHRGEIRVRSEIGKGSLFIVVIPVSKADYSKDELSDQVLQYIPNTEEVDMDVLDVGEVEIEDSNGFSHNPVLMIVEDNLELLEFMKVSLDEKYQIFAAKDGQEALGKLRTVLPDLIISDVMMPVMDGFELTRRLKNNIETSHIPVILLTAKSGAENKLTGLKTGADFYIEKPFYLDILEQNIENIISTRKNLIERFKSDVYVPVSEMAHSESDKLFIEKLTNIIKDNISDPNLDVTFLIREMGVSRSLLHLKLKSLVDSSTTEFIRSIRLREAVKLIAGGKYNISEAAYETGFSSPTYFTRRFKEYYGKSPREYFNI